MKSLSLLIFIFFVSSSTPAQRLHVGVFGGLAAYNGDLTDKILPKNVTNGAIGVTLNYELRDQVFVRGGFTYSVVGGADRYSEDPELRNRNLSFETTIKEFNLVGEYYFLNLYEQKYSPYVFAGLAVYRFNPYTYFNGERVYLKPLSTEGQGLAGYPGQNPYKLTQFAIPYGGGIKVAINDRFRVALELGMRKLFTDYLDDVSSRYADPNDLLAERGQLAVDLSYRSDELPDGNPNYPAKGSIRGGEKRKDIYYFTGLHLTYRLGGGSALLGGPSRKKYGCPIVPQ